MEMDSQNITKQAQQKRFRSRNRDKLRPFLAIWAALMMLGILIAFCLTNNPAVLLETTVIGIAIFLVYNFYFRNES